MLSLISLILNTIPELQIKIEIYSNESNDSNTTNRLNESKVITLSENPIFEIIEAICITWFTIEYIFRLWASPDKKHFFKGVLNFIDLISIIPFFVSIFLSSKNYFSVEHFNNARRALQFFRVLKIFRILKLARHSTGLQSFGFTLRRSHQELGLLMVFLTTSVLLFSSLAFYAEKDQPSTRFTSIPAAFW
jgi:potassium voltage-gated channel Shab-related subfamily B protein 1